MKYKTTSSRNSNPSYYTANATDTPTLGIYSKETVFISTPKSREQDRILSVNKKLREINNE